MRNPMKILKYFLISLLIISFTDAQTITRDGKEITTFTKEQALEMLKARDAQWEGKLAKADSLIEMYKYGEEMYDDTIFKLEEQIKLDSLLLNAKSAQINLLKTRDEANKKMVELVKPKWYQNNYIWIALGFILGKI
tara:strand:- start:215 stop:625 length:411 start_codon:yes stop_codon:yes gene_type:complete